MALAQLTLYTRPGCHLCEQMLSALQPLRREFEFTVAEVDVDADPRLRRRYGTDVPVLAAGDTELCRHFLDAAAVRAHCAKFR